MTGIVQRVQRAAVQVSGETVGAIEHGLILYLGIFADDTDFDAEILARKVANLRIFCDENEKMNRSVLDVGGGVLVISNFTLCADTKKGNRPSFSHAMLPQQANEMYMRFADNLRKNGIIEVETGVFGADMKVNAFCDGPINIILNTAIWR